MFPSKYTSTYSYAFNGKLHDDDIYGKDNSYDYGARMYDPRLGRFLSIEPLAKKYPDISVYSFVANSPILFVDKDGNEIIVHGSNEFKNQILSALQKLTSDKLSIDKDGRVLAIHNNIQNNAKPYGTKLVGFLVGTKKTVNIYEAKGDVSTETGENKTVQKGQGNSVVSINTSQPIGVKDVSGKNSIPPMQIIVGHELIHASHIAKGTTDNTASTKFDPDGPGMPEPLSKEEVNTRKGENTLRREQGVILRAIPLSVGGMTELPSIEIKPSKKPDSPH